MKYYNVVTVNSDELHILDSTYFKQKTILDLNGKKEGVGLLALNRKELDDFVKDNPEIKTFFCGHRVYEYKSGKMKFKHFYNSTMKQYYNSYINCFNKVEYYKNKYHNYKNDFIDNGRVRFLGFKRLRYCNNSLNYTLPFSIYSPKKSRDEKIPLVILLHGKGGGGESGLNPIVSFYYLIMKLKRNQKKNPCIVLVPSLPKFLSFTIPKGSERNNGFRSIFDSLFDKIVKEYPIDINRVYIIGVSNGAGGVWSQLRLNPERYAAAIAISGWSDDISDEFFESIKDNHIWVCHGGKDKSVGIKEFSHDGINTLYGSDVLVENLEKTNKNVKYSRYENYGHSSALFKKFLREDWHSWLFQQRKIQDKRD